MSPKPLRKRLKNWLIFQFIRGLIGFVRLLPRRAALWFFESMAGLAFQLIKKEREKTMRHLQIAFGATHAEAEIRAMALETFRALGRNAVEALRLPQLLREGLEKHVRFLGREHLDRARARGKGVLCLTGHIGCWELVASFIAQRYPLAVVAATLYDSRLDEILLRQREQAGYQTFPRTAAGTKAILRWFRNGGLLGILIDQDTRVDGEFVDFFGRPAYTPAGMVVLAERTGAALVPIAIHMNEDFTHTIEARPEIPLQNTGEARADRIANVLRCSKAVEAFIREHPTQWVWMHERWKTPAPNRDEVEAA